MNFLLVLRACYLMEVINKILSNICFNRIHSRRLISLILNYIVKLSEMNQVQILCHFVMENFFPKKI
jgi:hypothetical protein